MAKQASRKRVGSPLTPEMLLKMGMFRGFPPTPADFDPQGNWTHTYRIWGCHGYLNSGNHDVGYLQIERIRKEDPVSYSLKITQELIQTHGVVNEIKAEVECLHILIASPISWQLTSRIIDPHGKTKDSLTIEEKVTYKNNDILEVKTGGKIFERKVKSPLTSDWGLFSLVQELPYLQEESKREFHMLEGLSLLKEDQRISFQGVHDVKIGDQEMPLNLFEQIGRGVLPYEYWLDDQHRLLMAVTMSRVYLLDDKAKETTDKYKTSLQQAYMRQAGSSRGTK